VNWFVCLSVCLCIAVKDCLSGMLIWDTAHRFTAAEILDHPWISSVSAIYSILRILYYVSIAICIRWLWRKM